MVSIKQTPLFTIAFSRPRNSTCIMRADIRGATNFAGNVNIISIQPVPQATNAFTLQLCFSAIESIFAGSSTKPKLSETGLLYSPGTNLKISSNKILENPSLL